jgi:hypothetical protein
VFYKYIDLRVPDRTLALSHEADALGNPLQQLPSQGSAEAFTHVLRMGVALGRRYPGAMGPRARALPPQLTASASSRHSCEPARW